MRHSRNFALVFGKCFLIGYFPTPLFNQLDVRIQKKWTFEGWRLAVFLDIRNAYNYQNQEGIIYNYDFSQQTPLLGLPIIPALGVRGEF